MSRTLHETIVGTDLFIPAVNDYFSIASAAMPNGDDAFVINPSSVSNPDYRAFANSPTLVPNVMKQAGNAFSLSMWVRMPSGGTAQNKAASIFRIQNSASSDSAANAGYPLSCFVQINTNGLFNLQLVGWKIPQIAISGFPNPGNLGTNAWCFGVFRIPAPGGGNVSTYLGGDLGIITGASAVTAGTETFSTDNRFAFGKYSDNSNNATYTGLVPGQELAKPIHIGKLTFHDHLLSLTECEMMYLAMTT